ncbi:MAG: DNA alkylation repair protein [Dysgonamonadaceae bacterium]|jgi:3-methyladenine DNA glycosylase AlkD|nr:DNA alkylation repair protein [Dysgonamonadaceae bacterium]
MKRINENEKIILDELLSVANPEKAQFLQKFFKTGPGQYAEGDVFLGIVVPLTRSIAKAFRQTPLPELHKLQTNQYHEARLCALLILTERCKKADEKEREDLYHFYLQHTDYINNWDLVDLSCPRIVGEYLLNKDRSILYHLAGNPHLWEQRIAIVSTLTFIRKGEFRDTFALAEKLIHHPHDLIHKASGWMLRETGKKNREALTDFLENYAILLPRTTLRYAIEHYPEDQRQYFLKKK